MTGKEFLNSIANGKSDIVQTLLDILAENGSGYCVIGGLAVNAYVEPVVSLDIDIVLAIPDVETVVNAARKREWKVEQFEHSVILSASDSDLRVQIQTDPRYQEFIAGAEQREVLGYPNAGSEIGGRVAGEGVGLPGSNAPAEQAAERPGRRITNPRGVSGTVNQSSAEFERGVG